MDVLQCDTFFFHCLQFGQVGCGNTEDQTSPQLVKTLVDQVYLWAQKYISIRSFVDLHSI
jgi:hypothetical protein